MLQTRIDPRKIFHFLTAGSPENIPFLQFFRSEKWRFLSGKMDSGVTGMIGLLFLRPQIGREPGEPRGRSLGRDGGDASRPKYWSSVGALSSQIRPRGWGAHRPKFGTKVGGAALNTCFGHCAAELYEVEALNLNIVHFLVCNQR